MILEHVAIWTNNLESLREYYTKYFGAVSNQKYINPKKKFENRIPNYEIRKIDETPPYQPPASPLLAGSQ